MPIILFIFVFRTIKIKNLSGAATGAATGVLTTGAAVTGAGVTDDGIDAFGTLEFFGRFFITFFTMSEIVSFDVTTSVTILRTVVSFNAILLMCSILFAPGQVMENHSNKHMNIGVHTDYHIINYTLYPLSTSDRKWVARTMVTYVDLYACGKPVIGFTTNIKAISQTNTHRQKKCRRTRNI